MEFSSTFIGANCALIILYIIGFAWIALNISRRCRGVAPDERKWECVSFTDLKIGDKLLATKHCDVHGKPFAGRVIALNHKRDDIEVEVELDINYGRSPGVLVMTDHIHYGGEQKAWRRK